ncbi:excisionase family DNA-binding protein [Salinisphaera sp. P385]|uniref:Excisionase family DNA-binding protein n=1 Tax=Spectribacter acetivorans TaxID=3075603 RepID=A0ABU3BBP8_9GAMM|nr:excisionase family DNA-binding protein [Salinisphaera sp. P385]MDT0619912.1 excisionase family DNA-binding protein [Salinisphaera sp. P385]
MTSIAESAPTSHHADEPLVPSEADRELAHRGKVVLMDAFRHQDNAQGVRSRLVIEDGETQDIELPPSTARLLLTILDHMAEGRSISLTPYDAEVSTQVAADILNVSRPFVIKLVEDGTIPCRRVGSHRRLRMADVVAHKHVMEAEFEQAARRLTELGQELGGYD